MGNILRGNNWDEKSTSVKNQQDPMRMHGTGGQEENLLVLLKPQQITLLFLRVSVTTSLSNRGGEKPDNSLRLWRRANRQRVEGVTTRSERDGDMDRLCHGRQKPFLGLVWAECWKTNKKGQIPENQFLLREAVITLRCSHPEHKCGACSLDQNPLTVTDRLVWNYTNCA